MRRISFMLQYKFNEFHKENHKKRKTFVWFREPLTRLEKRVSKQQCSQQLCGWHTVLVHYKIKYDFYVLPLLLLKPISALQCVSHCVCCENESVLYFCCYDSTFAIAFVHVS